MNKILSILAIAVIAAVGLGAIAVPATVDVHAAYNYSTPAASGATPTNETGGNTTAGNSTG